MNLLWFLYFYLLSSYTVSASSTTSEKPRTTCEKKFSDLVRNPETKLWKNGVVPFTMDSNFTARDVAVINGAFKTFEKYTCIRFRPKTDSDKDFLHMINIIDGCITDVGFHTNEQFITLESPMCTRHVGTVLHELLHVVGFYHEHSRWDRDDYVNVMWDKVTSDSCDFFTKRGQASSFTFGLPYDFQSVLHYPSWGFSADNQPTLVAKNPEMQPLMGQRRGLSRIDIMRVNRLYSCPNEDPVENKIFASLPIQRNRKK